MAGKFGKREQATLLGLGSLVAIGALHMLIFSPRAVAFSENYEERETSQAAASTVKLLEPGVSLRAFESKTKAIGKSYQEIVNELRISKPKAFNTITMDNVKVKAKPGQTEEEFELVKIEALKKIRKKARDAQLDLVYALFDELREFAPESVAGDTGATRMPFIAPDGPWRLPQSLAEDAKGAILEDIIREAREIQALLRMIDKEDLRRMQQTLYERELGKLGFREDYYRDTRPNGLSGQGEYVALIHKMSIAQLIERALESGERRFGEDLTREEIYSLLGMTAPDTPLIDASNGNELATSELYLLYEELRFIVKMLQVATDKGVLEITRMTLEEPSYLLAREDNTYPWHRESFSAGQRSPVTPSPYISVGFERTDPMYIKAMPAGDDALGYVLPVVVDFRASNAAGWEFLYEILRAHPMDEIDEMHINAILGSTTGELAWNVKFLHVPMLFAADRSALQREALKKAQAERFDGTRLKEKREALLDAQKRAGKKGYSSY